MVGVKRKSVEDDFVFTIDDDDEVELEEIEDETTAAAPSKKRKRDSEAKDTAAGKASKKSKKDKKGKKAGKKQHGGEESAEEDAVEEERNWMDDGEDDGAMASDFEFQIGDVDAGVVEDFDGWGLSKKEELEKKGGDKKAVDIDEIIARRRKSKAEAEGKTAGDVEADKDESEAEEFTGFDNEEEDEYLAEDGFGMGANSKDESDGEEDEEKDEDEDSDFSDESDSDESVAPPVAHPDDEVSDESGSEDEEEDPEEAKKRADFFAPEEENVDGHKPANSKAGGSFQQFSLSRPILKGLTSIGFTEPTPIQQKTIPVALLGKDVVGGAVTGSGKTAAFMIPILERLLYRPKKVPTTRVAILMPTRELAVQCFNVAKKLAAFTDITFAQIVGGFSLREQEQVLKTRPDVVIATPGRFIDHMRNSPSFAVDTLEILVLDEADRMLEDGFADELNEILTTIPKSRQTMLFSATMTDTVDKLIRVGLNRPVRLMVDSKKQSASGLVQEFLRLRPGREKLRLAYLMHLCETVYTDRVIIFFRQKKEAHRVRIIFGLCGLKAAELHGSMSQEQRISAVEAFRSGTASFLLATDLASRGLDIKNVSTVINYEAPQSHEIYVHRVGRTARAGRTGRSCTLAAEPDRKVVKAAVKAAREQGAKVVSRQVPAEVADAWGKKLEAMEEEVEEILKEEKEERALAQVERDVRKGENLVVHQDEIMGRPKRTWFESEQDKKKAKLAGLKELNEGGGKEKKRKLSGKEKKKLESRDEMGGRVWKKGRAERDGKGAVENLKALKKQSKKAGGKPMGKPAGKPRGGKGRR